MVNESIFVEVESSRGESQDVFSKFILAEGLLGDGRVSLSMDIFRFDVGDVASVPWNGGAFGVGRVLDENEDVPCYGIGRTKIDTCGLYANW